LLLSFKKEVRSGLKAQGFMRGADFVMIPLSGINAPTDFIVGRRPSLSYKIKTEKERIENNVDGIEAVKQMIYKTLMTDRYKYEIYNWDYGVGIDGLLGKSKEYVKAELPRRIEEALTADDRVYSVGDFEFQNVNKTELRVKFTVKTVFGDINYSWEANV